MDEREGRIGYWVSGVAHGSLILWAILGGALFRPQPSPMVRTTQVSTISGAEFEAMAAAARGAGPVGADSTAVATLPDPVDPAEDGAARPVDAIPPQSGQAAALEQPDTAESVPDLSDFAPAAPVEVATDLPAPRPNQTDGAETAPQVPDTPPAPVAEAQPNRPALPTPDAAAVPVAPRSALALDASRRPEDRPADLVESFNRRVAEAAAAEAARQAAADAAAAAARQATADAAAEAAAEADRQAAAERERQAAADAAAEAERQAAAEAEQERRAAAEAAEERRAEAARQAAEEERQAADAAAAEAERRASAEAEEARRAAAEAAAEEERRAEAARQAAEAERQAAEEAERQATEEAERRAAAEAEEERRAAAAAEEERRAEAARQAKEAERQAAAEAERRAAAEAEEERRAAAEAAAAEAERQAEAARQAAAEQAAREAADRQALEDALRDAQGGAGGQDAASGSDTAGSPSQTIEGGSGASAGLDPLAAALAGAMAGTGAAADPANDPSGPPADMMQLTPSPIQATPLPDAAQGLPLGDPLTLSERDGLRFAIQDCWNLGALSVEASQMTVSVGFTLSPDGVPDQNSMRIAGYQGGSESAAQQGFEVARRAILMCGRAGFDLPASKYGRWRDVVVDFRPDGVAFQ
ncbi:protein TolA [Paracoccus sp. Arc7-R13]|uniref:protein TolA n=1 Tax=Paracoccus sp. Arc7-R13 TaxID=2500532 RepID=UPI000FDCC54D|nr:protein TolA [Paracoccus sp. Arc7-R13]AZY94868.1 protein TolA [Paracoccus sp. Arc7-R13]